MNFGKNSLAVYKLQYQLPLVTKYQPKVITLAINKSLKEIAKYIFENSENCKLLALATGEAPLPLAFEASPQIALLSLINNFKTVASRLIRREFKNYLQPFYRKPYFWKGSYCFFSTGRALLEIIKQQLEAQKKTQKIELS